MRTHQSGRLVQAALAMIALILAFAVSACGDEDEPTASTPAASTSTEAAAPAEGKIQPVAGAEGKTIKIGSKNFTESIILGNIYGEALKEAGFKVEYDLNLGLENVANKAIEDGDIDGYPEYTGTALTALLDVDPKDVPKDETAAYEEAKKRYKEKFDFVALPQTPFTDSNAVGMTKEKAAELGDPKKISDLKSPNRELSLAASAECFKRSDCGKGLQEVYGLKFKEIPIDVAQRHEVILTGKSDLTIPFTTDGAIAANEEVILEDDKDLFPPYNVTFVLSQAAADKLGPEGQEVITTVQKGLSTEVMSELNSRVDLDKEKAEDVAAEYLKDYIA